MKFVAVSVEEAKTIAARRGQRQSDWRDLVKEFMAAEIPAAKLDLSELGLDRNGAPRKPQSVASAILGQVRATEKGAPKQFPVSVKLRNTNPEAESDADKEYAVYLIRDDLTEGEAEGEDPDETQADEDAE